MKVSLLLLVALGIQATPATPPQPPQTFRSGTEVVEVDVRVFKDGRFVTDLRPEDFELKEDGIPQKIQSLTLISAPSAPGTSSTLSTVSTAPLAPSAPSAPSAPPPQVWLFVFDTPHLSPSGLQHTRDAVVKFIDERWHQGDLGGIVFDGRMANNRLTSDRAELRAAAQGVKTPGDQRTRQFEMTRDWPRFQDEYEIIRVGLDNDRETTQQVAMRACTDDPNQCNAAAMAVREKATRLVNDIQRATLNTLSTVQSLANGLARMAGPKTIVFLSDGFVAERMETPLRQAVGDAARAGAHFYAIDARGLNKGSQSTIIDQPYAESTIGGGAHFDMQSDGTNSLAVDTGGFAIRNENNFGRALDEIQRDAAAYYVLGYSPTNAALDGKYRTIQVKVNRAGVKVRSRRGYLAVAPARMLKAESRGAEGAKGAGSAKGAELEPAVPAAALSAPAPSAPAPSAPSAPLAPSALSSAPPAPPAPSAPSSAPLARLAPTGPASTDPAAARSGWEAYQRGDVDGAARDLAVAAQDPSARPWVFYALGMSQFARQRYGDAASAWDRVRRVVPDFEPVYFSLADAYSSEHDEADAIRVLHEAEKRWPSDPEVADAIGVIEIRRGALDAAIESFERAIKVAPKDALGYFNLARAHQMRMVKFQRYDERLQKRVGADEDRRRAIENFQKYLELGGPYDKQAREAVAALQWK